MNELFVPVVGRPRKVKTPEQLLSLFKDYVQDRSERMLTFKEDEEGFVGQSEINKTKTKTKHHPLSIGDFCIFLGNCRNWWNELPPEFLGVKSYIADWIFHYQLKGAESGEFNANIVARELGLAEKREDTVKVAELPGGMSKEQAKDFIANLNK